jgi:hypothetical protein
MTVSFKNIIIYYLSFFSINNVSGFKQNGAGGLTRVNRRIAKSPSCSDTGKQCLLFFTGGSNLFQSKIYGEFINVLESRDIDVYDVPFNYELSQKDIDDLYSCCGCDCDCDCDCGYQGVNIMGHSSGCTTMMNQCVGLRGINHVFLLDPVNTNFFEDDWKIKIINDHNNDNNDNNDNDGIMSLSFIRAMKSYKITVDPFGLPFIPGFELMAKDFYLYVDNKISISVSVVKNLDFEDFGHSDILNQRLSNFMHNIRLSVGNKNRGVEVRQKYFITILSFILKTIS